MAGDLATANVQAPPDPPGPMEDLLGLMDDLPVASSNPTSGVADLALSPSATLDAPTFQQQWR